ncbi:MAG: hypothetical protein KC414_12405, partial [Romboutsia sp.]|nr:hypothetical protein [Romboutsia sp.]
MSNESGRPIGINTDIVLEMFQIMGNNKTANDILIVPWARGYSQAKSKTAAVALFSTTRTKAREDLFKWVGPISVAANSLIVLKNNPHQVE